MTLREFRMALKKPEEKNKKIKNRTPARNIQHGRWKAQL
jgi:hypothetical protein